MAAPAESSFKMRLPNGRNVELLSEEGANEAVECLGIGFLSANLNESDGPVAMSRQSLQTSTDAGQRAPVIESIFRSYLMIGALADKASPEKVEASIPESEIEALVEHIKHALGTISQDNNWLRTGALEKHDLELLNTIVPYAKHWCFIKVFMARGGFEALTKFCVSRKGIPSAEVSSVIIVILHDAHITLQQKWGGDTPKAFNVLEKSGLLGQVIRCMGISPRPYDTDASLGVLDSLQECSKLIRKKLKSGTPTGDILDAVIAGKDGGLAKQKDTNADIKKRLMNLQKMAIMSNDGFATTPHMGKDTPENTVMNCGKICRKCDKAETQLGGASLMKCSTCKATYYCGRECQVADWKSHKIMCKLATEGGFSSSHAKAVESAVMSFVKTNYYSIVDECYKKCKEYNVPKKELVIEINFFGDAPALRDEFKVGLTSRYLEGSRPDEPDWFSKGTSVYKNNIGRWLVGAKDHYDRMTSDRLLAFCVYGDGNSGVYKLSLMNPVTGKELLSDEAVDCIGREDHDGMVAILGQMQTDAYYRESLVRRCRQMQMGFSANSAGLDSDSESDC
jgi:hypothetical protein